ncbi:MAG TPA: hypothetical protein VM938_00060 [Acidimicrobiales bacterium]|nr:hypothetical protein [Acidimicrobiales bacterium]
MKRSLSMVLVAGLLAVGAAGCSRDKLRSGEARLDVEGRALVSVAGKAAKVVERSQRLHFGDRVKLEQGTARVVSGDGRSYDLRCAADSCTEFELAASPNLMTGDLLVATEGAPVVVRTAGSEVEVTGAARVSRSLAVSAAAYRGHVVLRSGGPAFTVPALRQASIPAIGVLPTSAAPVAYNDTDEWDRRHLGAAMAFGRELEARSRAFGPNVRAGEGRTPGFYKQVLPALDNEPSFAASLLDGARPPGETLVGAVITVAGKQSSFGERWQSVFRFRDEGAAWGLVALDQAVADAPALVRDLDLAIGRAPLGFSGPATVAAGPSPTTPTPTRPGPGGSGGSTTTTTRPRNGGTTPTTQPDDPDEPVPPVTTQTPIDPLVAPVVDTLNGLLDPLP